MHYASLGCSGIRKLEVKMYASGHIIYPIGHILYPMYLIISLTKQINQATCNDTEYNLHSDSRMHLINLSLGKEQLINRHFGALI